MDKQVVTRFAPSPTGTMHIGNLRSALYQYLEAKRNNGRCILRIEDTDRTRLVAESMNDFQILLDWIGLVFDEGPYTGGPNGPYIQSERLEIYKKHVQQLIDNGWAYYCFCTADELKAEKDEGSMMYSKKCRALDKEEVEKKLAQKLPYVVRLKVPRDKTLSYVDGIYGKIEFDTNTVDDQVLLKSDGFPTYHLAVVVDDHLMEVTHMIRANEWISSTPKQLLLYEAFGWEIPNITHLPPILAKDKKKKLSKRDGAVSVNEFIKKGYLREALVNYLVLSGWHPQDDREFFTLEEFVSEFSIDRMNRAGSAFDLDKLNWFNKEYLKKMSVEEIISRFKDIDLDERLQNIDQDYLRKIVEIEKNRMIILSDINNVGDYYFAKPSLKAEDLIFKKSTKEVTLSGLRLSLEILENISGSETAMEILEAMKAKVAEAGLTNGDLFWPVRYALTGVAQSPSPNELIWVLGKMESRERIEQAIKELEG